MQPVCPERERERESSKKSVRKWPKPIRSELLQKRIIANWVMLHLAHKVAQHTLYFLYQLARRPSNFSIPGFASQTMGTFLGQNARFPRNSLNFRLLRIFSGKWLFRIFKFCHSRCLSYRFLSDFLQINLQNRFRIDFNALTIKLLRVAPCFVQSLYARRWKLHRKRFEA